MLFSPMLDRVMNGAPDRVWRWLMFGLWCLTATLLLFNPYVYPKINRDHPFSSLMAVSASAAIVVGAAWWFFFLSQAPHVINARIVDREYEDGQSVEGITWKPTWQDVRVTIQNKGDDHLELFELHLTPDWVWLHHLQQVSNIQDCRLTGLRAPDMEIEEIIPGNTKKKHDSEGGWLQLNAQVKLQCGKLPARSEIELIAAIENQKLNSYVSKMLWQTTGDPDDRKFLPTAMKAMDGRKVKQVQLRLSGSYRYRKAMFTFSERIKANPVAPLRVTIPLS